MKTYFFKVLKKILKFTSNLLILIMTFNKENLFNANCNNVNYIYSIYQFYNKNSETEQLKN